MPKPLAKAIRGIPTGHRWNPSQALTLFAYEGLALLVEASERGGVVAARIYAPLMAGYQGPADADQARAVHGAVLAYLEAVRHAPPFADVLTALHADLLGHHGGNGLGQHFTPWDLSCLASSLAHDHRKRHPREMGLARVYEPCTGAGGLVLAQLQDFEGDLAGVRVEANDLDPLCAALTALQLLANQMMHRKALGECVVTVGDALVGRGGVRLGFASVGVRAALKPISTPWEAFEVVAAGWGHE